MKTTIGWLLLAVFLLGSCQRVQRGQSCACYYWRTTFRLSDRERDFLREHHVNRLYVRYFDVVPDDVEGSLPNATLSFDDSLPRGIEVVPVVYVLNDCMRQDDNQLAQRIWKRVRQMNQTHGVGEIRELQIDCDWTMQTRPRFFRFMEELRRICHGSRVKLSATIRLHQLSQPVPPADRGVLMVYNTGDVTRFSKQKPILDLRDVRPYLHDLPDYALPLSAAYPLFTWRVLFRAGRYVGIMHGDDDLPVLPGDTIVTRQPSLQDILQTQQAIEDVRADADREVILYDISEKNITRFNSKDYEKIYRNR